MNLTPSSATDAFQSIASCAPETLALAKDEFSILWFRETYPPTLKFDSEHRFVH
jgi:hypothetical protein